MRHYKVTWRLPGGGGYVPLGPIGEGDYHTDKYGFEIVYAPSAKEALRIVRAAMPYATVSGKVGIL